MTGIVKVLVAAVALIASAGAASAQREPAYAAARAAGQIGEQPDGYLGVVGAGTAQARAIAAHINIQRKAAYADKAAAAGATIDDMAITSGCNLIVQTAVGEKYKAPNGSWKTRTAAPPERIASCI